MKKFLCIFLSLYLVVSAGKTILYRACSHAAWKIACQRNGFLIFDWDADGLYLLNPLNNYGDDFIVLVDKTK